MGSNEISAGLEIRLLGPFEVALAGRAVHIGSPKQRAVLALLGLQAGKVVTSDSLCDLVWDEDQPASPSATLQSLISRLRRTLGGDAGGAVEARDVLRTRGPGWVLDVEPAAVDALRFQEMTARARSRRARGEGVAAAADLADALGLWRGPALADVADSGFLAAQATRLDGARLDAVEDLAEAELATGRAAEALARLEEHVEANPLRERAWGLLMVALYRLGRQAAALRAFQQVRGILGEQVGLEPSPELADIEQRILRHDPTLGGSPPPGAGGAGVWVPPGAGTDPEPARSPPPVPSVEVPLARPPGEFADYSVVVVEDHDFQRRTVVQLLRGLGVGSVTEAANGVEALRILQAGSAPDVIICDIDMPGMDGVEFVARVSESNLACAIVIASGLEAEVLRAVEAIGEGHGLHVLAALQKPLTARRLGEVLRQYARLNHERVSHVDGVALGEEELRDALDSGELAARFEPRIDLTRGVVSSVETSGCWHGLSGAPIPPAVFVPALERHGLLGAYVERLVAESCALVDHAGRAGLDADGPVRVAVDVSPLSLSDASLADWLTEIVQRHGQDPRRFVFELDDVIVARAPVTALEVLTRLRVKGFGVSMGHGGVGPQLSHQLRRVPLSELKLYRRLVSAAGDDPKRLTMLEAACAGARDAGLRVVAGGCDSRADFDVLLSLGCSEAQGRFVAEPLPAADLVAWALTGYAPGEPGGVG